MWVFDQVGSIWSNIYLWVVHSTSHSRGKEKEKRKGLYIYIYIFRAKPICKSGCIYLANWNQRKSMGWWVRSGIVTLTWGEERVALNVKHFISFQNLSLLLAGNGMMGATTIWRLSYLIINTIHHLIDKLFSFKALSNNNNHVYDFLHCFSNLCDHF